MNLEALTAFLAIVFGVGAALAPIVTALVALVKTTAADALPARYYPAVSVALGVLLAIGLVYVAPVSIGLTLQLAGLAGLIAGLIASSLFERGKTNSEPPVVPHA